MVIIWVYEIELCHMGKAVETVIWCARKLLEDQMYPGIENLILPMLSYPGCQVTSSCEIASKRIQELLEAYSKINK